MALWTQPQNREIRGTVTICAVTGSGLSARSECDWLSADEIESPEPWVRGFTTARLQRILPERIPEHSGTMCFKKKKKAAHSRRCEKKGKHTRKMKQDDRDTKYQRMAGLDLVVDLFSVTFESSKPQDWANGCFDPKLSEGQPAIPSKLMQLYGIKKVRKVGDPGGEWAGVTEQVALEPVQWCVDQSGNRWTDRSHLQASPG